MKTTKGYLLIGSNSGDRFKLIQEAVNLLGISEGLEVLKTSALYETEPWGVKNQNWFLNIAVEIKTTLSEQALLEKCQAIEKILGRNRNNEIRWGERPIDIDIIFYGDKIIETENLKIPHIYMHKRAFVLVPLLELIPEFVHPVLNKTVSQLYDDLEEPEDVVLYGTRSLL